MKYLPPFTPAQNDPKIKGVQELSKFGTSYISNISTSILMSKIIFMKYFYKFDISNIPILILMLKIIFIKYLPPVGPKLVPKLKMLKIY